MQDQIDVPSFITELNAEFTRLSGGLFKLRFVTHDEAAVQMSNVGVLSALAATLLRTDLPFAKVVWIVEGTTRTASGIAGALKTAIEKIAYGDEGRAGLEWERNRLLHDAFTAVAGAYFHEFSHAFANEFANVPERRGATDDAGLPRGYILPLGETDPEAGALDVSLRLAYHLTDPEKVMAIVFRFRDVPTQELGPVMVTFLSLAALRSDLSLEEFADLARLSKEMHARP